MNVVASDAIDATPHKVGDLRILVRLLAGSAGLNFNNTVLTLDTPGGSYRYTYNETIDTDRVSSSTSKYNIYYVQVGTMYQTGYLNHGDVAKIILHIEPEIEENQNVRIKLIPRVGQYTQIEFDTPDSMNQRMISVWPS